MSERGGCICICRNWWFVHTHALVESTECIRRTWWFRTPNKATPQASFNQASMHAMFSGVLRTPYVLEPHSPLVDPQSLLPIVWGLSRLSMEYVLYGVLCVCVCSLAMMQLRPEGTVNKQKGSSAPQTDWLIVYWVEYVRSTPQRTLTLRAENVSRRHIYRIDCQEGTPGSTVDQFFDSSLSTASWIECRGRQVGISQFCIRSHLQSVRCLEK